MNQGRPDRIESLIRLAGERDMPSSDGMQRARDAAEQAWRRALVEQPQAPMARRRWTGPRGLALAAGVAALGFFAWNQLATHAPAMPVSQVVALEGEALLRFEESQVPVAVDLPLYPGALLVASQGRLALSFGDATSLRLDRGAQLRIEAGDRVTLLAGALYVDSGGVNVPSSLRIATPAGDVRHVGTQFLVTVTQEATRVRVREGRVLLAPAAGGTAHDLASGDEIEYRDGEANWRRGLPTFGPEWDWATRVAPLFDAENRPLSELLDWLVREQGWQLRYASAAVQAQAHEIRLHGSFERLDAAVILDRLQVVTGLRLAVRDGVLWVGSVS